MKIIQKILPSVPVLHSSIQFFLMLTLNLAPGKSKFDR